MGTNNNHKKKIIALGIFSVVTVIAVIIGFFYIQYKKTHISTDDAFVEGTIHTVSTKVHGTVLKVYVRDNQLVNKGDLLVELEPDIYVENLRKAEAALRAEKKRFNEIKARIKAQRKKVEAARLALREAISRREASKAAVKAREAEVKAREAVLRQAETDLKRAESLYHKEVISRDRYDRARTAYDTALASFKVAKELKKQAEAALRAHKSIIDRAEATVQAEEALLEQVKAALQTQAQQVNRRQADVNLAQLNLSYTKIYAPSKGYVTKKSVEIGNQVRPGQPLMAVVSLDDVYIVANYKETKVRNIRPGQRVKIKVDAYPDKVFWGKVQSIMAGTGAVFSLFPPENATGNYVKVVQRIPVKIVLDKGTDTEHLLRIGMSVVPTVLVK